MSTETTDLEVTIKRTEECTIVVDVPTQDLEHLMANPMEVVAIAIEQDIDFEPYDENTEVLTIHKL